MGRRPAGPDERERVRAGVPGGRRGVVADGHVAIRLFTAGSRLFTNGSPLPSTEHHRRVPLTGRRRVLPADPLRRPLQTALAAAQTRPHGGKGPTLTFASWSAWLRTDDSGEIGSIAAHRDEVNRSRISRTENRRTQRRNAEKRRRFAVDPRARLRRDRERNHVVRCPIRIKQRLLLRRPLRRPAACPYGSDAPRSSTSSFRPSSPSCSPTRQQAARRRGRRAGVRRE